MIDHGATTMWERWNGDQMISDPSMNSFNHYSYGAVADWIYRYAAGVDTTPTDPGFHTVVLDPHFDARLGSVNFEYDSPYGAIYSAWKVTGDKAVWSVTLPANTTGWLPLTTEQALKYTLDGTALNQNSKVKFIQRDIQRGDEHNGKTGVALEAGTYNFEVILK